VLPERADDERRDPPLRALVERPRVERDAERPLDVRRPPLRVEPVEREVLRPPERELLRPPEREVLRPRALVPREVDREVDRRAVARERDVVVRRRPDVATRRRPARRLPVRRSAAGISSVATAFVSWSICLLRKSRMRSSSRRMRFAS